MTVKPIRESGMTFGPFPPGLCFYIEKSQIYRHLQNGVRMAEFLLLRVNKGNQPVVWIVEAKSSSPRPESPIFERFIEDIREKLVNAFSLGIAARLKRHPSWSDELPAAFQSLVLTDVDFRFVLVIKDHREDRLPPLQDALKKALHATVKTWALAPASVVVLNKMSAARHGLILGSDV